MVSEAILFTACANSFDLQQKHADNSTKRIVAISTEDISDQFHVYVKATGLLAFTVVKRPSPPAVILYFPDTILDTPQVLYKVKSETVGEIALSKVDAGMPTSRIEISLIKAVPYKVDRNGSDFRISFLKAIPPTSEIAEKGKQGQTAKPQPVLPNQSNPPVQKGHDAQGTQMKRKNRKLGFYRALIIGIDDYRDERIPDLITAEKDAWAVADVLRDRYGFQINMFLGRKATRRAIYKALRDLAESSQVNENVLIYYAGHGEIDRVYNDGWWIPSDAEAGNPLTYLENVQVQKAMQSMAARHVLLISDSCYSGTLFGTARAMPQVISERYYLNLYNEKSRWGMTSGNREPVSDSGSEGHSVFAYQFLKALKNNKKSYLSTQEIYTRIAPVISNNSEQTPVCRPIRNTGDQGGEFVFAQETATLLP